MKFNKIVIFGISEQIFSAIKFCDKKKIKLSIIAGTRQKNSNQIERDIFKRLKEIKFSNIEYVSSIRYSKEYKNIYNKKIDFIISLGSPFIFKKNLINKFKGKIINSHGAPLPEYKGGGGLTWRYLNADNRGRVLFHIVNEKIDQGKIIFQKKFRFNINKSILDWINLQNYHEKLAIIKILDMIYKNRIIQSKKQNNLLGSYFPRINSAINGYINFSWKGNEIHRFIGAFSYPYEGAKTFINNHKIYILNSSFIKNKNINKHSFLNGLIFEKKNNYIYCLVNGGYLKIKESQIKTFYKINLGDRFYTPNIFLEKSLNFRPKYTAKGLS